LQLKNRDANKRLRLIITIKINCIKNIYFSLLKVEVGHKKRVQKHQKKAFKTHKKKSQKLKFNPNYYTTTFL